MEEDDDEVEDDDDDNDDASNYPTYLPGKLLDQSIYEDASYEQSMEVIIIIG